MQSSWASELTRFANDCETASSDQATQLVVRLYDLLATGPFASLLEGVGREDITRRCDADCADAAALALVANCGVMLSRAPRGIVIASVVLHGRNEEFTASSRSIALALCEALVGAVGEPTPTAAEVRTDRHSADRP